MTTVEDHCTKISCNSNFQEEMACEPVDLLTPLEIRGARLRNRIAMSPMCQYCAQDGEADDWHLVHLGSRAVGGAGLVMTEATAVSPEGRIAPGDLGIWADKHIEPLRRIARFVERQGAVPGIQLAHAGRKASCRAPWEGGLPLSSGEGGWPVCAPSALSFSEGHPMPSALDERGIAQILDQFADAARRAVAAEFQVFEIHAAHGYLLHEFLSPLSNHRTDRYGGSLENRIRIVIEVAERLREIIPTTAPLFMRISATDWAEGGWDLEQSIELARHLGQCGVDLIDCSSGALVPVAKIPVGKGYQVSFAARIKRATRMRTSAVGMITEPEHANEIIQRCDADLVMIGREMLRDPYWAARAYEALNEEPPWPIQYGYAIRRRAPR